MADSNYTKKELARAMRELMEEQPFEKITISQVCDKGHLNRKSFYYHFRDKYDLINWIFDMDFIAITQENTADSWKSMELFCSYLYENRTFYRKVLKIDGQNSFSEHFHDIVYPLFYDRMKIIIGKDDIPPLCIDFFADGVLCALKRWLLSKDSMPPDQFVSILKSILQGTAVAICQNMT